MTPLVLSAVDREAAWLREHGDGLPALLAEQGGPWSVIQAYRSRTPATRKTSIFVLRGQLSDVRFANQRRLRTHGLRLAVWWPIGATTTQAGLWEDEARALDAAVDLLITRVRGTVVDHTHGGRFLQVAEGSSGQIQVSFTDPDQTLSGPQPCLRADVSYSADDADYTA